FRSVSKKQRRPRPASARLAAKTLLPLPAAPRTATTRRRVLGRRLRGLKGVLMAVGGRFARGTAASYAVPTASRASYPPPPLAHLRTLVRPTLGKRVGAVPKLRPHDPAARLAPPQFQAPPGVGPHAGKVPAAATHLGFGSMTRSGYVTEPRLRPIRRLGSPPAT